jgi:hypothetical protein
MNPGTRRTIGLAVFAIGTALCGVWGYAWTSSALSPFMTLEEPDLTTFEMVMASLTFPVLLYAPACTFWLTRRALPSMPAKALRIGHLASIGVWIAAGLALLATASSLLPATGLAGFLTGVTLHSLMPVQAFWVNGGLALWIASPRSPVVHKRDREDLGTADR